MVDPLEHPFVAWGDGDTGRWWNGRFGRMARRYVWLKSNGATWRVEARDGDGDSRVWGMDYPDETAARAMVAELVARVLTSGAT